MNRKEELSTGKRVLIAGGGIIGLSTAFHLCRDYTHNISEIIVLDAAEGPASCASGKAGCFLAKEWCDNYEAKGLARRGFQLHHQYASTMNGISRWDYRPVESFSAELTLTDGSMIDKKHQARNGPSKTTTSINKKLNLQGNAVLQEGSDNTSVFNADIVRTFTKIGGKEKKNNKYNTAQVNPKKLTECLLEECFQMTNRVTTQETTQQQKGSHENCDNTSESMMKFSFIDKAEIVKFHSVQNNDHSKKNKITGLVYNKNGKEIELLGDVVIIALGPWTGPFVNSCIDNFQAEFRGHSLNIKRIPNVHEKPIRAHSIVLRPEREIPAQALFIEITDTRKNQNLNDDPENPHLPFTLNHQEFEIYPRPDGTVYICGMTDHTPMPTRTVTEIDIPPNFCSCLTLLELGGLVSDSFQQPTDSLNEKENTMEAHVCYLPYSFDNVPILGPIDDDQNTVFVATGHGCWGILMGLSSGEAMAHLVNSKPESTYPYADLSLYSPNRF